MYVCIYFLLFSTVPMACGGSKARGLIRATAAAPCHSHARSKPHLRPTPELMATN